MVRPSGRRGDDDLGPVMDTTGRVEGRTVTASSRGVRGRHSTSDLPATPTHLALGFQHDTSEPGSSTQPPAIPFRSRPPLQPHLSHTIVPYEPYRSAQPSSHLTDTVYDPYLHGPTIRPRIPNRSATQEPILEFIGQPRQIGAEFFYQMFGAAPQDSSCSTNGYFHTEYGFSSSVPYVSRPADRGVGEEQERVGSLHIEGEADERGDDDGDGGDDDQDEGDDAGDEEQPVPVAPVAHANGSDGRPRHGEGKGLTGSFMLVMSKIAGSRNKRPEVAREVPAPTQKRKKPEEGGLVDLELIPSYGGHVAGPIWSGQYRSSLKFRSRYMALKGWELTDAHY
ncbi:hypothetical protein M9H77_07420 [Catharanthus roseus]|uniref:Uncharacterized protein n=1 Tax=Catharanthus roseus TaxID=4058 RepID=A0ACC0BV25_CATRO|nr:hypothetical protein M9H77_07420 [Catharanthus roseus]